MAGIADKFMAWQFVRRLAMPFTQMDAFRLGLIDAQGRFLVSQQDLVTTQQQNALTPFDIIIINLKRLLAQLPGGSSNIANAAAGLLLLKQWGLNRYISPPHQQSLNYVPMYTREDQINDTFALKEELDYFMKLVEDAPVMSSGSGAIPGTVGEPVVNPEQHKKYKKKNSTVGINKRFAESISLTYHKELNPKIWDIMGNLKHEVHAKLLQIAYAWANFAKIPPNMIQDIIITGGNVNFNYTDMSDIDLHLIIDRGMLNPDHDLVNEYLSDKKILWTLSHSELNIYGYPIELYAQDVTEVPHQDQGVYSIIQDKWIQRPQNLNLDFDSNSQLQQKADFYKEMIDKMLEQHATSDAIDVLKKKIYKMRGDSIAKNGEFGFGNLVFKELRNSGYLDKLANYIKHDLDMALSLE